MGPGTSRRMMFTWKTKKWHDKVLTGPSNTNRRERELERDRVIDTERWGERKDGDP